MWSGNTPIWSGTLPMSWLRANGPFCGRAPLKFMNQVHTCLNVHRQHTFNRKPLILCFSIYWLFLSGTINLKGSSPTNCHIPKPSGVIWWSLQPLMLRAKEGDLGMSRPGIEPTNSQSHGGHSTIRGKTWTTFLLGRLIHVSVKGELCFSSDGQKHKQNQDNL